MLGVAFSSHGAQNSAGAFLCSRTLVSSITETIDEPSRDWEWSLAEHLKMLTIMITLSRLIMCVESDRFALRNMYTRFLAGAVTSSRP